MFPLKRNHRHVVNDRCDAVPLGYTLLTHKWMSTRIFRGDSTADGLA